MLETPTIVVTEAQATAVVRLTIPRAEIQRVMGAAIGEVMAAVAAQNLAPTGPVFSRHFRIDPQVFDFEVGVPVAAPIAPAGRVKAGVLPATTVARTVYQGSYEGLGAAWGELDRWIHAQGRTPAPGIWERYLTGPESGADSSAWRTELNHQLEDLMNSNPVVWFEIYVQDMDRAKRFYEAVLGVTLEKLPAGDLEMWAFPYSAERSGAGGALVKFAGVPSGGNSTLVYFASEDCVTEEARIAPNGGSVHRPKLSIGQYGFITLGVDTEGNMFGLHSRK